MAEVSNLKLKLTAMEKERLDFDDRFGDSEVKKHKHVHEGNNCVRMSLFENVSCCALIVMLVIG